MTCQIAVRVTPRAANPGVVGWRAGADGLAGTTSRHKRVAVPLDLDEVRRRIGA